MQPHTCEIMQCRDGVLHPHARDACKEVESSSELAYNSDIYPEQHELAAQAVAHALHAVLGGRIAADEGRRELAAHGGHHHDAPRAARQGRVRAQQRKKRLSATRRADQHLQQCPSPRLPPCLANRHAPG